MIETLKLFHEEKDIIEIRVIGKVTSTGYFSDMGQAIKEAERYDGKANVYFVLNKISPACYHRENRDSIIDKAASTSDGDIERRRWVLIDFDPKRASKTSATDEEKKRAEEVMKQAGTYLRQYGFKSPVIADSGNGWHLLYKIDLPNDTESKKLIENFLKACDMLFSNDKVSVDMSVFNASRITKLYGTMAVKGANTKERPHRRSQITFIPKNVEATPKEKIQAIADMLPKPKPIQGDFSIDEFIRKHSIRVAKTSTWDGGIRYVLDQCPFDSAHGKDSAIIQLSNGALAFHCFHNGCAYHGWKEYRELYEPAHEREYEKHERYERREKKPEVNLNPVMPKEIDEATQKILDKANRVKDIKPFDRSNIEIFSSGIPTLDESVELLFGKVGLVTGVNGSGKSTLLAQFMVEALEQNHNVFAYSGELKDDEFQFWVDLQAAGSDHLIKEVSKKGKTYYKIKKDAKTQIHDWYGERFYLYNNDESMKYEDILKTIEAYRVHRNCRVIFLDNFMTMDISDLDDKELNAQTKFIWSLAKYVKKNNVLVFLVIHPKKIYDGICQKQDVLGSGNFSNAIDYMFIVHRTNETFKTHLEKRKISKTIKQYLEQSSNVIEIGKDRWSGKEGLNVAMTYCDDSKRLIDQNTPEQKYKKYSWDNQPKGDSYEPAPWDR